MCEKGLHIDVVGTDKSDWGAKSNLHHRKILPRRPSSTKLVSFSTIDCFATTIYTHMMDPKHEISCWVCSHTNEPPSSYPWTRALVSPVDRLSGFMPPGHLIMSAKISAEAQIFPAIYQEPKCVSDEIFLLRDRRYEQRSVATTLLQNEN